MIQTSPDSAPRPHRRERGGRGRSRVPQLKVSGEAGRGAVCVYLRGFWVVFSLRFGQSRASFPRNTRVSTCGAARRGAPPTTPLLLPLPLLVFPGAAGEVQSHSQHIAESRARPVTRTPSFSGLKTHPSPAQPSSAPVVSLRRGAERQP